MTKICVIVPCYRCGNYFEQNFEKLLLIEAQFEKEHSIEYVLVDDGSDDNTIEVLLNLREKYPNKTKVVELARNFGAYNAVMAGFYYGDGDCFVAIAADLQEPPELIVQMFKLWQDGYKMVLGTRKKIDNPLFSRLSSWIFHKLVRTFLLKKAPKNGFDFFLIDDVVRKDLLRMAERNTNLLYLMIWLGYPYEMVEYDKKSREFGRSEWTIGKKIKLFVDTFFAFSLLPLRLLGFLGVLMLVGSFPFLLLDLIQNAVENTNFVAKLVLSVGGLILMGIHFIGEYVWRIGEEVKGRPIFLTSEFFDKKEVEAPPRTKLGFNFWDKTDE